MKEPPTMFRFVKIPNEILNTNQLSGLYTNETFFKEFCDDLKKATTEVIIESPFITSNRFYELLPVLKRLRRKGIAVMVNTRDPKEHEARFEKQAYGAVRTLQDLGVVVLYTTKLHRKIAIIDRQISWEGSLNILSYSDSCEIMRRTKDCRYAENVITFLKIY